jgi:hypothetical protein
MLLSNRYKFFVIAANVLAEVQNPNKKCFRSQKHRKYHTNFVICKLCLYAKVKHVRTLGQVHSFLDISVPNIFSKTRGKLMQL